MAEAKTEQEPSIEEILESIRQIISEDGTPPAPAAADTGTQAAPAAVVDTPSLSLAPETPPPTAAPAVDLSAATPPATAAKLATPDNVIELIDKITPESSMDKQPEQPAMSEGASSLISDATASASTAAMAKLLATNIVVERQTSDRIGSVTLEDMAMELMRPLIKTWLDQNLSSIVEKMVQKEIEKLSRRAMDK